MFSFFKNKNNYKEKKKSNYYLLLKLKNKIK